MATIKKESPQSRRERRVCREAKKKKIKHLNPTLFLVFIGPFLLTSCTTLGTAPQSEKYQMEMTLHKTRADLEEAKHDLHTLKMELSILEGKMVNHEDQMASIKKETFDLHQTKLENCHVQILGLERKFALLETKQEETSLWLQKIASISNEMSKALAQGKEKINELERSLATQSKSATELSKKMTLALDQTPKLE